MRVLITGSNGFIGKNLLVRLSEVKGFEPICFDRDNSLDDLQKKIRQADAVIHLAAVNRPVNPKEFSEVNVNLTKRLCEFIEESKRSIPLIFSSSIQASVGSDYGLSKFFAEESVAKLAEKTGNQVSIFRLPNVFGKWCKPNYNSVVATFCHNIANDLPIQINDPGKKIALVYIDDVINGFLDELHGMQTGVSYKSILPEYEITLQELAEQIKAFKNCRTSLVSEHVGVGLVRALYATYISHFTPENFVYNLPRHEDERGVFVEMLKTPDCGQFSFFTARTGATRGGHYHHTKTEKFLVIKGVARFGFRHVLTDEKYEFVTTCDRPQVVETVPGWTHDITNIGDDELVVMLWANEIFDCDHPDTIASKV